MESLIEMKSVLPVLSLRGRTLGCHRVPVRPRACSNLEPPIVVLTAAPDPAGRAAEVHAEGWLGKPFEIADLEAIVRRFAKSPAR